jgi:hypothetical protein
MRRKEQFADDDYFHYYFEVPYFVKTKEGIEDYDIDATDALLKNVFESAKLENSFKEFDIISIKINEFEDDYFVIDVVVDNKLDSDQIKETKNKRVKIIFFIMVSFFNTKM